MSLKKTEEALEILKAQAIGSPTLKPFVDAAFAEVEAIKMAAVDLSEGDGAKVETWILMESIAKESKA